METMNDVDTQNHLTSMREVEDFKTTPQKTYFAYLSSDGQRITTWMGDTLATVTHRFKEWQPNIGGKRQTVRATGINGRKYSVLTFGGSMYCRMREIK